MRIVRAARDLGMRTIAVFSEADRGALWTRLADESLCIGPPPARQSYLNIERILAAAELSGAEAVHPGYGLLSENAEFARAVLGAGLVFVGPAPETIAQMGDKVRARAAAAACGVPILGGSDAPVSSVEAALSVANSVGWPVVVKASFGGGGRGMRVVRSAGELAAAMEQSAREAQASFGQAEIYVERFLEPIRHVEVQVLGDRHGRLIHLGDRDCSVQRRHQKLIEEAPAPALPERLRTRIAAAALKVASSVSYQSAGTVEFLVDVANDAFYFLEMNTRLQVEHGVTELVTGIDLVAAQLRVASGAPLGLNQSDIHVSGHAIEVRIAAEDPLAGFRVSPGVLRTVRQPTAPWVRSDFGVESGDSVPGYYDSMFGKIMAWGTDRDLARRRLANALGELVIEGLPTTAPYLRQLLDEPTFTACRHHTASIELDWVPDPGRYTPANISLPAATDAAANHMRLTVRTVEIPWGAGSTSVAVYGVVPEASAATVASSRTYRGGATGSRSRAEDAHLVAAPMDAVVVHTPVIAGATVFKGDALAILEAMKMEVIIRSPRDGVVAAVHVSAGNAVQSGSILVALEITEPRVNPLDPER